LIRKSSRLLRSGTKIDGIIDESVSGAVEVKIFAQLRPGRRLAYHKRFSNGTNEPLWDLHASRATVAKGMGRRDGLLGQSRRAIQRIK
jgi:hypothetical protein